MFFIAAIPWTYLSLITASEKPESENQLLPLLLIGAAAILIMLIILFIPFWLYNGPKLLRLLLSRFRRFTADESWENALGSTGFTYDKRQDIFYSLLDPWQREYGYCRLYDEAAAPLSMIIDCEPIRFEYAKKKWMIEFWKGQYGMTTGSEVGVFNTEESDLDIPNFFTGTFYHSADNADMLPITFTLFKNGKPLFSRSDRHWWLTGFILGEFSEPSELKMQIRITFKDMGMANAFVKALKEIGYSSGEYYQNGTIVRVTYGEPHTSQPISRTAATDWIIQQKNKLLCDQYQELTKDLGGTPEKLEFIQNKSPKMFKQVLNIGKTKPLYKNYKKIQKQLKKTKRTVE